LLRADGAEVARASRMDEPGALVLEPALPLDAADYLIRIALAAEAPASAGSGHAVPDHFTRPYRLLVSQ
jgi:hypothetical protein